MKKILPLFLYQVKIFFVDDDPHLLDSLKSLFPTALFFKHASDAATLLKKSGTISNMLWNEKKLQEIDLFDDTTINNVRFSIKNIINLYLSGDKYKIPGILVVDYDMPDINGLELCRSVELLPIKKILLTGKYDITDAITALNDKLIDCYIEKGKPSTSKNIAFYINQLNQIYFENLTEKIMASSFGLNFITDCNYVRIVESIIEKYDIKEYYLISNTGTYLLKNTTNTFTLIIYNSDDLEEFYDTFQNFQPLTAIIKHAREKKLLPFFGLGVAPEKICFEEWLHYFSDSIYENGYYWSLVDYAK